MEKDIRKTIRKIISESLNNNDFYNHKLEEGIFNMFSKKNNTTQAINKPLAQSSQKPQDLASATPEQLEKMYKELNEKLKQIENQKKLLDAQEKAFAASMQSINQWMMKKK